jgi:hypothetical protein
MATAMFAEALDNFQHSTGLIPESRSFTFSYNLCFSLKVRDAVSHPYTIKQMCWCQS